ncbi:hypothetical protein EDB81DRAFT_203169 [Dactylonectria macrodidyma]|uniref:AAA+ ATPase domain-containing protein n=1 Tax=Dactylonectria macrodidyma TaxID=307937 RepID=A0A9P9DVY5_9HYPO|nr:hypothetical protein EDB81DRAFT_203169 [Dactylonectria macrodidyma]
MVSNGANTEDKPLKTFSVGPPTPPTPAQRDDTQPQPSSLGLPGVSPPRASHDKGDNETPRALGLADELQALKSRILELEQQALSDSTEPAQDTRDPELIDRIDDYKRMEQCLYRHRKEWAENTPVRPLYMGLGRRSNRPLYGPSGPWSYHWKVLDIGTKKYQRPDPFDPKHQCEDADDDVEGEFDHTIDYEHRRDRVRKAFEWEMDRLYLVEEGEARKRARMKDLEDQRQKQKANANWNAARAEDATDLDTEGETSTFPRPILNPGDWHLFKSCLSADPGASCLIDILIGEPVADNKVRVASDFFRNPSCLPRPETSQARKTVPMPVGQAQLPERIRIHSAAIARILGQLSNTGDLFSPQQLDSFVLIRPYKTLIQNEQALRDWCKMLDKKFGNKPVKSSQDVPEISEEKFAPGSDVDKRDKYSTEGAEEKSSQEPVPGLIYHGETPTDGSTVIMKEETDEQEVGRSEGTRSTYPKKEGEKEEKEGIEPNTQDSAEGSVTSESTGSSGDSDDLDDITKSAKAFEHLQCLLDFIDTTISPKRSHLQSDECQKVFFSDLWHLFRPGMEVIYGDCKQAYRVIRVASPAHRIVSGWESWYNAVSDQGKKRSKAAFSVTCVCVDFDGTHLGPVSRTFDFKRFEGQRDITSFEIYPLRYHRLNRADCTDLEWKDLQQYPANEQCRQKLIRRGVKFLEAAGVKHLYYDGPTLEVREEVESQVVVDFETAFSFEEEPKDHLKKPILEVLIGNTPASKEADDDDDDDPTPSYCRGVCCKGEVLVHNDTYVDDMQSTQYIESLLPKTPTQDNPSVAILPRLLKEMQTGPGNSVVATDDELVIMSYRVFGFVLRSRKWAQLDLTFLTDVQPSDIGVLTAPSQSVEDEKKIGDDTNAPKGAFDRLVLEQGHKPMIVSLIAQHFRDKESKGGLTEQVDIVKGKGKGLILLLHGAPGVGKTSTAEGVAEMFKKPLLQITCGDLGTTAKEVEQTLETNFTLASRWGCILLLDEADVFLAERTKEDFKRNGLVAAFLRVLEYYAGILFLTTNRVGDFDEAFTSRIHISLYYPELNAEKTVEVFKINMEMIEERFARKKRRIDIDKMSVGSFASQHFAAHPHARWNGRQIRNACQTALALAEFEAQGNSHEAILKPDAVVHLTVAHFDTVRNAYLEFNKYMNDLYGSNTARRAKEAKLRAIWVDENDRIVGGSGIDRKAAFARAVRPNVQQQGGFQQQQNYQQPQTYPQQQGYQQNQGYQGSQGYQQNQGYPQSQGFQQPQGVQQQQGFQQPQVFQPNQTPNQQQGFQQQPAGGLQQQQQPQSQPNIATTQPGYGDSSQMAMQGQQFPHNQGGNIPVSSVPAGSFQGSQPGFVQGDGQVVQQPRRSPTWFNQGIQEMFVASGGPESGHFQQGNAPLAGGGGGGGGFGSGQQGVGG